jgi:hypothetical protein
MLKESTIWFSTPIRDQWPVQPERVAPRLVAADHSGLDRQTDAALRLSNLPLQPYQVPRCEGMVTRAGKLQRGTMPTLQGKYIVPHFDEKAEANQEFTKRGVPTTLRRPAG